MKIAAIQMETRRGDVDWNLEHSLKLIEQASRQSPDLICFPESVLDGYACGNDKLSDYACPLSSNAVKLIGTTARRYNIWIMWTLAEARKEGVSNSVLLFDRTGSIQMTYRKVHLCRELNEHTSYIAGKQFFVTAVDDLKVGAMVCYDRHYPEASRTMKLMGADLILHPTATNWFKPDPQSINTAMMRTRAYENHCHILSVNQVNYGGGSALFGPWGDVLAMAGEEEEILYCSVESKLNMPDNYFEIMKTRCPNAYSQDMAICQ